MRDEQLIELVKHYEVIYNVKCDEYRDVSLRNAAWEEIAKLYGKTVNECKEDWNKLRNCYNNAMKRRHKKCGETGKKLPPWRYEEQMSFLKQHMHGISHIASDIDEDAYDSIPSPESIPSPKCILLAESIESPENDRVVSPTPSCSTSYKRKASPDGDYKHLANMVNLMNSSQDMRQIRNPELDEIDYFFLSMSETVKKLPRLDQIRIKLDLHEAVSKAELKYLEIKQNL